MVNSLLRPVTYLWLAALLSLAAWAAAAGAGPAPCDGAGYLFCLLFKSEGAAERAR